MLLLYISKLVPFQRILCVLALLPADKTQDPFVQVPRVVVYVPAATVDPTTIVNEVAFTTVAIAQVPLSFVCSVPEALATITTSPAAQPAVLATVTVTVVVPVATTCVGVVMLSILCPANIPRAP